MEDKIYDIVTDLIRGDITKDEAIDKLLGVAKYPNSNCDNMNKENKTLDKQENGNDFIHDVMPRFCFICGTKLMEVGLGWLQCESEQCGEVYLPFIDENNNQCLMHQRTPFSPK